MDKDKCSDLSVKNTKASYDPGWNDPPKMIYGAQQIPPSRPRNFLNKRVAFPLSGDSPTQAPAPLPPLLQLNVPPLPAVVPLSNAMPTHSQQIVPNNQEVCLDSETVLKDIKGILLQILEESSELGSKTSDINRRICVMEQMWTDGKLNTVHVQMRDLAYALRDDKPLIADEIHKELMVNNVSLVGAWMPGVKQLIYHCIARNELLAIDKE